MSRITNPQYQLDKIALDKTRKFLVGFNTKQDPRAIVETVIIPEANRSTLCVSSQVGCSLKCSFCHTGTQKLERSLTSGEGLFIKILSVESGLVTHYDCSCGTIHDCGYSQWRFSVQRRQEKDDFKYGVYGPGRALVQLEKRKQRDQDIDGSPRLELVETQDHSIDIWGRSIDPKDCNRIRSISSYIPACHKQCTERCVGAFEQVISAGDGAGSM